MSMVTCTCMLRRAPSAPLTGVWCDVQVLVQVELPRGERTTVMASNNTSLPELLQVHPHVHLVPYVLPPPVTWTDGV